MVAIIVAKEAVEVPIPISSPVDILRFSLLLGMMISQPGSIICEFLVFKRDTVPFM